MPAASNRATADRSLPDNGEIETEVHRFGRFAGDGRLVRVVRVVETSRVVRGAAADLASAR
ncbi:MAG TPA: hypothetical protein VIZ20_04010 [Streptosporangiaceae bacterium]